MGSQREERAQKGRAFRLCVVTDAGLIGDRALEHVVLDAIDGGATMVQYRDKMATMRERYERGLPVRDAVRRRDVPFIVNDHVDLALALGADGVHLGQDDLPASVARRVLGTGAIIGVSVGSLGEAVQAASDGADYVSIGPLYPTRTKPDAGEVVSKDLVREMAKTARVPVIAIGGINADNVEQVMRLGVTGVAVVSAVMKAEQPGAATRELRDRIERVAIEQR